MATLLGCAAHYCLSAPPARASAPADLPGIVWFSLALLALTTLLILWPQYGLASWPVIFCAALTLLTSWQFQRHTHRSAAPVFTLALVRQPHFAAVLLLPVATCYCYVVLLILMRCS